ncbi:hypothetical protein BSKO_00140 [Bryopsis sp. KO-2023]|nr:hypothetical protein BSKO_00140 [Bryopsis sp. KO-2023]
MEVELENERRLVDGWLSTNFPETGTSDGDSTGACGRGGDSEGVAGTSGTGPGITEGCEEGVMTVKLLTFLCSEVQLLSEFARKRFYPVLNVAGDRVISGSASLMGDSELQLAGLLPLLQDVLDFLEQLESLLSNLLCQVAAASSDGTKLVKDNVVGTSLKCVGRGLVVLLTVQTMVTLKILPLFFSYRRMLHTMMSKSDRVNAELSVLEEVQEQVVHQEESLRMGAFTNFIDAHVKHGRLGDILRGKKAGVMIETYIKTTISSISRRLNQYDENLWDREDLLGVLLLFVTFCWGGACPKDRKLLRVILDVHQKSPVLPLYCNLVVNPSRFLMDMLPSSMLSLIPYDYTSQASIQSSTHLSNLMSSVEINMETISFRGSVWSMELCALMDQGGDGFDVVQFITLVMEGVQLLVYVKGLMRSVVQLHVEQLEPLSKANLSIVANCIFSLKLLGESVEKCRNHVREHRKEFMEHYSNKMRAHLDSVQNVVHTMERNLRARRMDVGGNNRKVMEKLDICSFWVKIGLQALQGSTTLPQRFILEFTMESLSKVGILPEWVDTVGRVCLNRMEEAERIGDVLDSLVRCEFLYFHPELIRNAFQDVFTHPEEASKLPYLINGFLDAHHLVEQAGFGSKTVMLENEVHSLLRVHLIDPLSKRVESDLFQIVKQKGSDPFDRIRGNVLPLLKLRPLRLILREVSPAQCVTEHLSKTFRKLTIRGDLDWKTLCRLRNMAREKYGLDVEEIDCADGTAPASLDRITTREGLNAFVGSHMYNMHSQTFVANPRATTAQAMGVLPRMIGIDHFVNLIQADVVQVGSRALECLSDRSNVGNGNDESSHTNDNGNGDCGNGGNDVNRGVGDGESGLARPLSRAESRPDGIRPEVDASTSGEGMVVALGGLRHVVSGSAVPSMEGGSNTNENVQWSFLPHLADSRWKGSGRSLEALTSARQDPFPPGRVSCLVSILKQFIVEKMKELAELCASPETRSVFSQTTQRWHNARKAVAHHYPVAQAEIVRKEVIALLKAGTLSLNPLHRLRFHIVDLGKAVAIVMSLYHALSRFREQTLALLPRDFTLSNDSMGDFLGHIRAPEGVIEVGQDFDSAIAGFGRVSVVGAQYNKTLRGVFAEGNGAELAGEPSLQNLYILAPALTLDHVESMRSLKGQYQGLGLVTSATVTDDSFAIGLSYLLTMFDQVQKFAELLWFDSAHKDYHVRLNRLEVGPAARGRRAQGRRQDTDSQQAIRVMETLQGTMDELRLLEHTMTCAQLFFKLPDRDEQPTGI